MTDVLPAAVEFLHAEQLYCGDAIWCNSDPSLIDGDVLTWELWPMGTQNHQEIRITVRISDTFTWQDSLLNEVVIASDQPGIDVEAFTENNTAILELFQRRYELFLPTILK